MRTFLILLFIVFINFLSYPQKELSLREAINIAMNQNPTLQKSTNEIANYESDVKVSYGNFIPSLGASGNFNWTRSEEEGGQVTFGGSVFQLPATTTETRNYSASVSTGITLFDGLANFASLSQSKNNLEAANLNLERLKQNIVFQTISLYYQVINAEQLLKVKEEDVKYNQKNLETITERNKLGGATLADVYLQQVQAGNADLELIRAKNDLETAKSNLLYYLGLNVFEEYSLSDSLTSFQTEMLKSDVAQNYSNLSQMAEAALSNRFDYKSLQLNLESAYNGITIAKSGHLPVLSGNGSFFTRANQFENLFNSQTYSLGLTLSIPIFSGFTVSNRVQFAEVVAMNTEIDLNDMEREIKRNLQKTYLDLQASEKALSVSENNVTAASENLKIEQEKYSLGSGKLLDVLIANSNFTNAQTNYINAQYSYVVLSEQLKYYLGTLQYKNYE